MVKIIGHKKFRCDKNMDKDSSNHYIDEDNYIYILLSKNIKTKFKFLDKN